MAPAPFLLLGRRNSTVAGRSGLSICVRRTRMLMNRRFVVVVVASLSICTGGLAHDWFSPTRVSVRTGMLLHRDYSAVTMVTSSNGDVRIQSDTSADGKTTSVQLFLVGGRILLAKGGEITPGAEID